MTPSAAKPANRRRSPRRAARTTVKIECRKGTHGLGSNLVIAVLDVSERGVRLILKQPLDMIGEVEVVVSGYGMKKPLKCLGGVRWQLRIDDGSFCVGIEFQKLIPYREWQILASPV